MVQEILGTDPISGSRLVINSNFSTLDNEITLIENYLHPDTGIIDTLTKVSTNQLYVANSIIQMTGTSSIFGNKVYINNISSVNFLS